MGKRNNQIDDYIEGAEEFAKPILMHIREVVHQVCPEVEEKIKWVFPHFDYKGRMCSMVSFRQHCAFTFWKGSLIQGVKNISDKVQDSATGQFGRITSLNDLPDDAILAGLIKEAVRLNDHEIRIPASPKSRTNSEVTIPDDFAQALRENTQAHSVFKQFTPGKRKE